jgi:nicotinamidase-related amidase
MIIPNVDETAVILVDVQEKFVPAITDFDQCLPRWKIMLQAAELLHLTVVITEQYPNGLGHTIPELKDLCHDDWPVMEKTSFSALGDCTVKNYLHDKSIKNLILIGIETHVCILQTAIDAMQEGYQVFIPYDTVASRSKPNRDNALELMRDAGVHITSTESILFMLMRDAKHPAFKEISRLIR